MHRQTLEKFNGNGHAVAPINLFQRLVRQWETLHPYNGCHALKIRARIDAEKCNQAWHDALAALGLGRVRFSGGGYRYDNLNGDAADHSVVICPAGTCIEKYMAGEMNRPFDAGETVPFRPFLIHDGECSWIGLGYQHWVADALSIHLLLREWFVRLFDPAAAAKQQLRIGGSYLKLFGPQHSRWRTGAAVLSSLRWHSQLRRVRRIEDFKKFDPLAVGFLQRHLDDGLIGRLTVAARAAGVTVNDFFLAAIARVCKKYVPMKVRNGRRDLAIGSIVDLRSKSSQPLSDVFGLLLGFTTVTCKPENMGSWENLLGGIIEQTRRQKKDGTAEASWLRMLGGLTFGRFLSRRKMMNFYRKRLALAGACSNVNLNRAWEQNYHPDLLLQYLRAAPTGPITPLVFITTTLGDGLTVSLTYRNALVSESTAAAAMEMFVNCLGELAKRYRPAAVKI